MNLQDTEVAKDTILLKNLPDDVFDQVTARAHVQSFSRGETIFVQGQQAQNLYLVLNGLVKLFRMTSSGEEAVVGVFTKRGSFGEAVAFQDGIYPVTAESVTDSRVIALNAHELLSIMQSRPEVFSAILASTFSHLHDLVRDVERLKAKSGSQRLAEFLVELCPVDQGACTVTLPYDKVLIAGRIGMKPESLSRAIARLKSAGVVVKQNVAVVSDVQRLKAFAAEDRASNWSKRK